MGNKTFTPLTRCQVQQRNTVISKKTIFYWIVALAVSGGLGFWYYVAVTTVAQEIQASF